VWYNDLHYGLKDCTNCLNCNTDMNVYPCKECVFHNEWKPVDGSMGEEDGD